MGKQPLETFVHEGQEVIKTGREAVKELITIPGKPPRKLIQVEIRPLDDSFDTKKWVDPAQLFIIQPPKEHT